MRRTALALIMSFVLAGALSAQHRGGRGFGGGRTYGSPSGFGNILFPGTGSAPPMRANTAPTFAQRLGATVSGGHPGFPDGRGNRGQVGYPYAVPVFYGGYGYGYDYGAMPQAQAPPMAVVNNQPPQQPTVIINQYYTQDGSRPEVARNSQNGNSEGMRSYQAPIPSNPDPADVQYTPVSEQKATIYLLAYRDGSIHGSLAYWIEGDTLHYITPHGSHNSASMDLIDKAFSEQLNRERKIEFSLAMDR